MKTLRKILATPFYVLQFVVALCVLGPMLMMSKLLMLGMIGGQRHVYWPIVVGKRIVTGEPRWQPHDVRLGICPRTIEEQERLEAELGDCGAADHHLRSSPVVPGVPVMLHNGAQIGLDPGRITGAAPVALADLPPAPDALTPGERPSLDALRAELRARDKTRLHYGPSGPIPVMGAMMEYEFVACDYTNDVDAWTKITDPAIIRNIDATHAQMNQHGGVRGKAQTRQGPATPELIVRLIDRDFSAANKYLARGQAVKIER